MDDGSLLDESVLAGTDPNFPPFESIEDGELRGFDIDLAESVVSRADFPFGGWKKFQFDALLPALVDGQIDIIVTALAITEDRAEYIAFSGAYYYRLVETLPIDANLSGEDTPTTPTEPGQGLAKEFAFGLRQEDDARLEVVNESLAEFREDGTHNDLFDKWFDLERLPPMSPRSPSDAQCLLPAPSSQYIWRYAERSTYHNRPLKQSYPTAYHG